MTRWLTEEEQITWRKLIALMNRIPYKLEVQLRADANLTHFAFSILVMLSEAPGMMLRMGELADGTSASLSRTSHAVAGLEKRGWIARSTAPKDARGSVAMLTDQGLLAVERIAPLHVEKVRQLVFDVLDPSQVRQLNQICSAVLAGEENGNLVN